MPGGIRIKPSRLFPQTTGAQGSVVEGGVFQESTARTFTVLAPLLPGCVCAGTRTGRKTLYSKPAAERLLKSCTAIEVVPSYWNPEPPSTQNATNSLLPAVEGPPA